MRDAVLRSKDLLLSLDGTIADAKELIYAFPASSKWKEGNIVNIVNRYERVLGRAICRGTVGSFYANGTYRTQTEFLILDVKGAK